VLARREHVIALEPKGRGLVGMTLRYPYEVRDEKLYFEDIPELKLSKEMLDLAAHIVQTKSGHFDPSQFEDRYENALIDLLKKKQAGEKIEPARELAPPRVGRGGRADRIPWRSYYPRGGNVRAGRRLSYDNPQAASVPSGLSDVRRREDEAPASVRGRRCCGDRRSRATEQKAVPYLRTGRSAHLFIRGAVADHCA
jgi:hypothetical protein